MEVTDCATLGTSNCCSTGIEVNREPDNPFIENKPASIERESPEHRALWRRAGGITTSPRSMGHAGTSAPPLDQPCGSVTGSPPVGGSGPRQRTTRLTP